MTLEECKVFLKIKGTVYIIDNLPAPGYFWKLDEYQPNNTKLGGVIMSDQFFLTEQEALNDLVQFVNEDYTRIRKTVIKTLTPITK